MRVQSYSRRDHTNTPTMYETIKTIICFPFMAIYVVIWATVYGYYDAKDAKEKNAQLRASRLAREQAEAERDERD